MRIKTNTCLGFIQLQNVSNEIFDNETLSGKDTFRQFVFAYIKFATDNA